MAPEELCRVKETNFIDVSGVISLWIWTKILWEYLNILNVLQDMLK